ncbi:MAG: GAF domain-containing protein [Acidobacteriota bacterium]
MSDGEAKAPSSLEASGRAGDALLTELRDTLERAARLVHALGANLGEPAPGLVGDDRAAELERRLSAAEADVSELADRLVESEHQVGRLMNLYVATYQLHAMLDPQVVRTAIADIAINLLGARRFVLLLQREEGGGYEIALREGLRPEVDGLWAGEVYSGGDPLVDETLAEGGLRFGPTAGSAILAAVPLKMQDEVFGALVVLELLEHKGKLRSDDKDLLDLLSAHAASALLAARLFAAKDRKLKTLESLIRLARGE